MKATPAVLRQFSSLATIVIFLTGTSANAADAVFSSGALTSDANSGVSTAKTYTALANVIGGNVVVNGATFIGSGAATSGTGWLLGGIPNTFGSGGNKTTSFGGQSIAGLFDGFQYNGTPGTITMSGLIIGQTYVTTLYCEDWAWTGTADRRQTFTASEGGSIVFNEDALEASMLRYTFVASSDTMTLTAAPVSGASLHLYGLSNEQVFTKSWISGADWTTPATWSPAGAPNGVGSNADFAAQIAPTTINLDANQTVGHLRFDGANAWTLSGANTLTLQTDAGGVSVVSTPSGSHTISTPVELNSDLMKSGAGTLTLDGALSGPQGVAVSAGALRLGQANGYTGATTVNAGAILDVNDTAQTLTALNGAGTVLNNGSAAQILTLESGTFSGNIANHTSGTGALELIKSSSGTLTLSGNSTYTGATNINDGTLVLSGALGSGTVTVNGPGSLIANSERSVDRPITLNGGSLGFSYFHVAVGPLTMNGGTMTTTNGAGAGGYESVFLMGNVTVGGSSASVIQAGGTTANGIHMAENGSGGSAIRMFDVADATGDSTADLIVSAALINGRADGAAVGLTKTGTGTMTLSGVNTYTGGTTVDGGTLTLVGNDGYSAIRGALTVNAGATVETVDEGTGLGWRDNGQSVQALNINGGTVTSVGAAMHIWSTMTGGVNMTGGTLQSNNGVSDPTSEYRLEWGNAALNTFASSDTATIAGRIRIRQEHNPTGLLFNVDDGAAEPDLLVSAAITDNGNANIIKAGSGTMILTGTNTYTGNTTVDNGKLTITNNSATTFADTSTVSIGASCVLELPNAVTDIVASLVIDGTPVPNGLYGASTPATAGFITGSGKIQVGTGYAGWAAANVGGDPANDDTDLDGVQNGVEYFMNAAAGFTANPAVVETAGPIRTITWPNGGNIPSAAYGTQFVVQTSLNLTDWENVLAGDPKLNNTSGSVIYTLPTGEGKFFVRLIVTPN